MQNVYPKEEKTTVRTPAELEAIHADRIVHCMNEGLEGEWGRIASRHYVLRKVTNDPASTAPYQQLWAEIEAEGCRFREISPSSCDSNKDYFVKLYATNKWLDPKKFYEGLKKEKGVSSWKDLEEVYGA